MASAVVAGVPAMTTTTESTSTTDESAAPVAPSAAVSKQIPIVCPGHTRPLAELQYVEISASPATSGGGGDDNNNNITCFLLSACHDKMPMMRNAQSGDWIGTWNGHKGAVWSCQMDSTGNLAATASGDYSCRVWDAITGKSLIELPHNGVMKTVHFSPNSEKLVTGGIGKNPTLRIYDLPDLLIHRNKKKNAKDPLLEIPQESPISKLIWLTDELVLCGCYNGKIYLWDTSGKDAPFTLVHTFDTKEGAEIRDMELKRIVSSSSSDTAKNILSVAAGSKVYFYNVDDTYELLHEYKMPIHFKEEGGVTLHPTASKFVAGGSDLWVRVFDFATGNQLECHKGHHGPIRCVRFSPDGNSFASGSEDGTIRLWKT